jgi:hypothetical protein
VTSALLSLVLAHGWALSVTGPPECVGREPLQALVEARVKDQFVEGGTPLEVVFESKQRGWTATVRWGPSHESLHAEGPDCHVLDARLASALALVLDPSSVTAAPATAPIPDRPTVRVHLEADDPRVRLSAIDQFMPSLVAVRVLCGVPCDKPLPAGATFFVTGLGIVPSEAFTLGLEVTRATVTVHVGHTGPRAGWSIMAGFGGAGLVAGLATLLVGALLHRAPLPAVGGAVGGGGAALLVGGLVGVALTSTRVNVTSE